MAEIPCAEIFHPQICEMINRGLGDLFPDIFMAGLFGHYTNSQSQSLIKMSHPFSITRRQIVIDCHHMDPLSGQGI